MGVAPYTLSRWFRDSEFVAELNARRMDLHAANGERLRAITAKAVGVLDAALEDPNPRVRLRAAEQVIQAVGLAKLAEPDRRETAEAVRLGWEFTDQYTAFIQALRIAREAMEADTRQWERERLLAGSPEERRQSEEERLAEFWEQYKIVSAQVEAACAERPYLLGYSPYFCGVKPETGTHADDETK